MIEIFGNYWTILKQRTFDAIVVTTNTTLRTNNELVMGAGIAKDFRDKFSNLSHSLGYMIKRRKECGLTLDDIIVTRVNDIYIVAFPTKNDWKLPSSLDLIEKNLQQLKFISEIFMWENVLMTRPGCGLGALSWNDVKPVCEKYLNNNFTIVEKK